MTPAQLSASARADATPPAGLTPAGRALWFTRRGDWEPAHAIAQDLDTPLGSWIHALLHLIEGDLGNARYWFSVAGRPARKPSEADALWEEIAAEALK
ncbi:hypothetical protein EBR16_06365 [bacterium]|jgi:hypothetical protein|nr:hypothetical protein [bacterium]